MVRFFLRVPVATGEVDVDWSGQLVAFGVNVTLNDVGFSTANLPHQSQFFFVDDNVIVGPLFLVDLLHVVSHVSFSVVGIIAGGAVVGFQFAVHEQVVQKLHPTVEHFWTMQAFQSELLVEL